MGLMPETVPFNQSIKLPFAESCAKDGLNKDSCQMNTPATDKAQRIADAAKRALDEVKQRKNNQGDPDLPTELGGRNGPEPTRFGDWEKKGITSDF